MAKTKIGKHLVQGGVFLEKRRRGSKPRLYVTQKGKVHSAPMHKNDPFLKCGKVFNPVLPKKLTLKDRPVVLVRVSLSTEGYENPGVLITFSSFVTSILRGKRFNRLTFRLVRSCEKGKNTVLMVWPFAREFVSDTNIKEPVVYNVCDSSPVRNSLCTYTLELIRVDLSQNTTYDITNKSLTAQIFNQVTSSKEGGDILE